MDSSLIKGLRKAGVPDAKRHLFVCLGPACCSKREGEHLWEAIKKRIKETGIPVMRTKAGCFRICKEGPLMVVYPEGTWYAKVTPAKFEVILKQHLIGGNPVKEWTIATNCLDCQNEEEPS